MAKKYSDQDLIDHFQQVWEKLGKQPSQGDMERAAPPGMGVYTKYFGSWRGFLLAQNCVPLRDSHSEQSLVDNFYRVWEELGYQPSGQEISRAGPPDVGSYIYHFGSWGNFLRMLGLTPLRGRAKAVEAKKALEKKEKQFTPEQIRDFIDAQICPWCGKGPFKVLAIHTYSTHGVGGMDLRELADLLPSPKIRICSEEVSVKQAAIQRKLWEESSPEHKRAEIARLAAIHVSPSTLPQERREKLFKYRAQKRKEAWENSTPEKRAATMEKMREAAQERERRPEYRELRRRLATKQAKIPESEYAVVVRRYKSGEEAREIALDYNCSAGTVGKIIRKTGNILSEEEYGARISKRNREWWAATSPELREEYRRRMAKRARDNLEDPEVRKKMEEGYLRRRVLSSAEEKKIIAQYKAGENAKTLAEKYGCSPNVVGRVLRKAGLTELQVLPTEEDELGCLPEIIRLREEGMGQREIAANVGLAVPRISRLLWEHRPDLAEATSVDIQAKKRAEKIHTLREEGKPVSEIMRLLGVSRNTVIRAYYDADHKYTPKAREKEKLFARHLEGATNAAIAEEFGLSACYVSELICRYRKERGLEYDRRQPQRRYHTEEYMHLLAEGQKRCSHCKEIKPLEEFYRRKNSYDGRMSWCKACCR